MLPSGRSMTWRKVFEKQWAPRRGGGETAGTGEARQARSRRERVPCGAPIRRLSQILFRY